MWRCNWMSSGKEKQKGNISCLFQYLHPLTVREVQGEGTRPHHLHIYRMRCDYPAYVMGKTQ